MRTYRDLYGGRLRGNQVGSFVKGGETFYLIRPGYDSQGRRHPQWTQVVHGDIPIWECKIGAIKALAPNAAVQRFETLWAKHIQPGALVPALAATKKARRTAFMDGRVGANAAPSITRDGPRHGKRYPA